jgi:predicted metal-binding membrane protein
MAGMNAEPSTSGFMLTGVTFVGAWVVMMAAMMLPSAAPMVLLYRAITEGSASARVLRTIMFVLAYLVAWGVFGVAVYVLQQVLAGVAAQSPAINAAWPFAVAGTLAAAGLYQFSGLKDMCLRQCRSPWSFLIPQWRPGIWGGIELGVRHGAYCIGCCWGLMAVLVVAGAMGLAWVTLVAVVIFAEKLLPPGRAAARIVGGLLLLLAGTVAVMPDLVHRLAA